MRRGRGRRGGGGSCWDLRRRGRGLQLACLWLESQPRPLVAQDKFPGPLSACSSLPQGGGHCLMGQYDSLGALAAAGPLLPVALALV